MKEYKLNDFIQFYIYELNNIITYEIKVYIQYLYDIMM